MGCIIILCLHLHTGKKLEDEYYKDIPHNEIHVMQIL